MVDLGDPALARTHPRFITRICTDKERARIAAAGDAKTLLWSLFAAKEAAYKVVVKLGEAPGMSHRKFAVDAELTSVRYGDRQLHLRIDANTDRIHAVATTYAGPVTRAAAPTPPGEAPGQAARRLLCAALAKQIPCEPTELEVVRPRVPGSWDGFGPPRVHRNSVPVPADVSLSHDGRFVAFAISTDAQKHSERTSTSTSSQ